MILPGWKSNISGLFSYLKDDTYKSRFFVEIIDYMYKIFLRNKGTQETYPFGVEKIVEI